jgi:glucose/arabinose dehydrogenase
MNNRWYVLSAVLLICLAMAACVPAPLASVPPTGAPILPATSTPLVSLPLTSVPIPPASSTPLVVSSSPAVSPTATVLPKPTPANNAPIATDVQLPSGFRATLFARLDGPRFMTYGPDGALYVAELGANRIVALVDVNNDGVADSPFVVADQLIAPSSMTFASDGSLYVGETTRITRLELDPTTHRAIKRNVVIDGLPSGHHTTRTVLFGPDGKLYVSIGSSCDVCIEKDERRATVMVYDADGKNGRVFARGLRNAVGLAIHPLTGELWATNNESDALGDNVPPDTVYIVRDGMNAGWPRCHSGSIADPGFGGSGACDGVARPAVELQAHSAPLGLAFYTGAQFPLEYRNGLFIAFHGSIYRSVPTGYKVVFVPLDGDKPAGPVKDFATGWLKGSQAAERPVGLAVAPDGSLMVSDDKGGYIYRITYGK